MPETTSKLFHKLRSRESGKAVLDQERTAPTCAQVLRELLEQIGLSVPEWIAAADISKSYAYQVLRGERIPSRDILLRTALVLRLSLKEAQRLLAFCNNIGPVYFCSFVLPLLHRQLLMPYLVGMYGLPLLYGLFLRYTKYRDLTTLLTKTDVKGSRVSWKKESLLEEIDDAVTSSIQSILSLGGYMILFNLLNLLPHILTGKPFAVLSPILEITGGLNLLGDKAPLYSLILLPFGGLSCIAQTYSCIKKTGLSITDYTLHKLLLTAVTGIYYLFWFLMVPSYFLL